LECAVEGAAAYLVSGDRLLLSLETYQGIQIVSPRVFLEVLHQCFAEAAARSGKSPLVILGLLRQGFHAYAEHPPSTM
jgi:hypothetical protein